MMPLMPEGHQHVHKIGALKREGAYTYSSTAKRSPSPNLGEELMKSLTREGVESYSSTAERSPSPNLGEELMEHLTREGHEKYLI